MCLESYISPSQLRLEKGLSMKLGIGSILQAD
jgi:hypothetical protein